MLLHGCSKVAMQRCTRWYPPTRGHPFHPCQQACNACQNMGKGPGRRTFKLLQFGCVIEQHQPAVTAVPGRAALHCKWQDAACRGQGRGGLCMSANLCIVCASRVQGTGRRWK